jgi:outer membrane protein OmpA-like peptidoglycan-associated protein
MKEIREKLFSSPPENMGTRINSIYSELAPIISADGTKLFFTRDKHPDNIGADKNQDVWMSKLEKDGRFSEAINLYEPVNNKNNNFAFSTNSDGTMLLMGKSSKFKDLASLSFVHFDNNVWSELQKFDFTKIDNKTNFVNFSFSQSMNIMFISMEREDTYGGLDLYFTTLTDSGWTEIKNLGPSVNTAADEITPYISNDNKTLYFATNGRPGYGSMDLFVTKSDDNYKNWSEPKNLGSDINTEGWEAYFTISSHNDYAYFVSSENSIGKEDIFRIQLPKEAQPEKSIIVRGTVTKENSNEAIGSKLEFRNLTTNRIVGIAYSDSISGFYQIVLPQSNKYGVNTVAEGYYSISKTLVFDSTSSNSIQLDLIMKPIKIGQTYELSNIFFEFGKSELNEQSNSELQRLIKFLNTNKTTEIKIFGYTDEIGNELNNMKLSDARAKSVYDYLINNGINKNRLTYEGKGEIKSNKIGKLEDSRKVEFKIIRDSK